MAQTKTLQRKKAKTTTMNPVVHFEILADNLTRAQEFYQKLFGWNIQKVEMPGMDYFMISTTDSDKMGQPKKPGAINGGLMPRDKTASQSLLVINVPDVDVYVTKVEQAGGKLVMPKMEVPNMGWYARVTDTEGNVIGLWQSMMKK